MTEIINAENQTEKQIEYATFWSRAGAYILDGIIVGAFTLFINAINIANFKSFLIYLLIAIVAIFYKPFMESKYGATFGKMALKLKVTDQNFNQIDFKQSLLRSIFLIFPAIFFVPIYYFAFNNPNLAEYTQIFEFSQGLAIEYPIQSWISNLSFIIIVVDIIVLLTDNTKTQRSLHDRIGKTYVIFDRK
ncbi:RDD family protein [Aequorivita sinensis]|uniref:RDD family protein n=1 Tax=Aequorivita sinensis TaxID=1382458 RepID=UPI001123BA64|nr:RDD family protein [Aequorivita sinensis]